MLNRERFIIITKNEVFIAASVDKVNKKAGMLVEKQEFKRIGADWVIIVNDDSLEFVQDKRRFASLPWHNLGRKKMTAMDYLPIINTLILFIVLVKK